MSRLIKRDVSLCVKQFVVTSEKRLSTLQLSVQMRYKFLVSYVSNN